ncbi:hypothetical protein A2716_02990 [candidate division WWE3 bacterium RIFCSPHIGHO2_01_FULL_40_23]|uniref:ASCH domain-containing protein n=1 Tax=candidate division WWE3 bacterium RIFCSPLOWO2_01_FULL_41_18 TaxID=1802625 RepID=A0A1F4VCE4_UNCKA|nr:MAG: hypothetical protein A2716_02990 [candidate division WWE3 bacterium RIFCSPHIGHO2_01_FULL_40_23]OGC54797.1 MAG: hypothetical protein A3A78_04945 [candidate division WWE3 bacterium RIFCSPLOWO2_01_FULL_41_18]
MDHVAILKKEWGLLKKILSGQKTVESRWYKTQVAPWDKIFKGDVVYFKDSGRPVTLKAKVLDVHQYFVKDNKQALGLMKKYTLRDLGAADIPQEIRNYILNKKYAIFVLLSEISEVPAFNIDKTGYGMQSAWMCVGDINKVKV